MLQTTHYDQLVILFDRWSYAGLLSIVAHETQMKVSVGEDVTMHINRSDMHYLYEIREQLRNCLTELNREVEANFLTMSRDQHDVIYLNKLAVIHNQIQDYLNNVYEVELSYFEGIRFDIEPPERVTIPKVQDSKGRQYDLLDEPFDPYWNQYVFEEQFVINDPEMPPVVIRLIKTIAEGFGVSANMIYRAITQSIAYKNHPELIQLTVSTKGITESPPKPESDVPSPEQMPEDKRRKRKQKEFLTWKQQLILLDKLDLLNSGPIGNIKTKEKQIKLLAQLLCISEGNVKKMLTYWEPNYDDESAIQDLLDDTVL